MNHFRHVTVVGGLRVDRRATIRSLRLSPELLGEVPTHRRLRGPFTGAGTVVRALVPQLQTRRSELVGRYDVEILTAAPELAAIVPNSRETLTSMAIPAERTRFYARLRTQRIADGLVELLRDGLPAGGPWSLVFEDVDQADPTDLEFLSAAVRRIDPANLQLVISMSTVESIDPSFVAVLEDRTDRVDVVVDSASAAPVPAAQTPELARQFVSSDGTADEPAVIGAYQALDPEERARLHSDRAAQLRAAGDQSLALGAILYHAERGSDAEHVAAGALHEALDLCVIQGFYEAAIDLGLRGLSIVDPQLDPETWWRFVTSTGLSMSILSRTTEAQELYESARVHSIKPSVHMACAYSIAMLYTRHNDPADRDEKKAKGWLNSAIATATLVEDPSERAFLSAFYRNGLALVEVNLGDPSRALELVNESIAGLDRLLEDDKHRLHRTVLKNNRARVYSMLGRLDEALADYAVVISADPQHAEHYLERGNIFRRLGRSAAALADYDRAIRLSPPFPEIYYNRADLYLSQGQIANALADFDYVIELDPTCVDAYVNRAGIRAEGGQWAAAHADALTGLRLDPGNCYLRTVLGQVLAEGGDPQGAIAEFDQALAADPGLLAAYAGRASAALDVGDCDLAIGDLTAAVDLEPNDPALRFNLAVALHNAGRSVEATAEMQVASLLDPDDEDIIAALAGGITAAA